MRKAREGLEERHDARIAKPQGGDALPVFEGGSLQAIERILGQDAVVTEALDFEELAIDLLAEIPEKRQVVDRLGDIEVVAVVDRRLGPQRTLLFEVLLDVGVFVFDMQTRLHAVGDHAGSIPVGRRRRGALESDGKQESDAVGPSEVEILTNHRFEEMVALHRPIKDLSEADVELVDGEPVVVSRGTFCGRQRPRQSVRPPIEEGLHVGGAQRITGRL